MRSHKLRVMFVAGVLAQIGAVVGRSQYAQSPSTYFRQLVVGKIGEFVQTQWDEHGSSGGGEAPGG